MRRTSSVLIAKSQARDPGADHGLRLDELTAVRAGAGVYGGQVLAENLQVPGTLRDPERGIVGRIGRLIEGHDISSRGQRVADVLCAYLPEGVVFPKRELVADPDVPLGQRRVGQRAAD